MEKPAGYAAALDSRVVAVAWISMVTVRTTVRVSVATVSASNASLSARCCAAMKRLRWRKRGRVLARDGSCVTDRVSAVST